jgi:hypothetical protein
MNIAPPNKSERAAMTMDRLLGRNDDLARWRRDSMEQIEARERARKEMRDVERREREREEQRAAMLTVEQVSAMIAAALEDERNFLWVVIGPALRQLLDEEREETQKALDLRAKVAEIEQLKAEITALKSAPAPVRLAKTWSPVGVCYRGDVVAHRGSLFQAVRDTGREPPHVDDWICLAQAGADGRTPEVKGVWSADVAYRALDICSLNGGAFIARFVTRRANVPARAGS